MQYKDDVIDQQRSVWSRIDIFLPKRQLCKAQNFHS